MKRFLIGLGLLGLLIASGFTARWSVNRFTDRLCRQLEEAEGALLAGNAVSGGNFAARAEETWRQNRLLLAAFSDHARLEEIGSGFVRLRFFTREGDTREAGALCAELALRLRQLQEDQGLSWESFL